MNQNETIERSETKSEIEILKKKYNEALRILEKAAENFMQTSIFSEQYKDVLEEIKRTEIELQKARQLYEKAKNGK